MPFCPRFCYSVTQDKLTVSQDLGANIFSGLKCDPNPVFLPRLYELPQFFFLPHHRTVTFTIAPMLLHSLVLASFASLIAPFGGFFASGLKRSFKIKDFGDSIPGHGGMTDRMDCQFIMGFFAYMYFHTFIAVYKVNLGTVLESAITKLGPEDQVELVKSMCRYLGFQGIVPEEVSSLSNTSRTVSFDTDKPQLAACIDHAMASSQ